MRILILWLTAAILGAGPVAAGSVPAGNQYTRLRANDAPVGGRFTIDAYFLDALDSTLTLPGPGRILALDFRDANGKNSFLIPIDLVIEDDDGRQWKRGFVPVGETRLAGLLGKSESRWALWWIPWGTDSLRWPSVGDLQLRYGFARAHFKTMTEGDAVRATRKIPWERIRKTRIAGGESTAGPAVNAAVFDEFPEVVTRRNPEYPLNARTFDFHGTVNVAALVSEMGVVTDAYVLQSNAEHELNVAALAAALKWTFAPGRKAGRAVPGVVVIPMRFSLGGGK